MPNHVTRPFELKAPVTATAMVVEVEHEKPFLMSVLYKTEGYWYRFCLKTKNCFVALREFVVGVGLDVLDQIIFEVFV